MKIKEKTTNINEIFNISVIIPVYNSEQTLPILLQRLTTILQSITDYYEILLINDGSKDYSWAVINQEAKTNDKIRAINLMRNYGQHNALICGVRHASYETIITIDDDLQHPPEEIPVLLKKLICNKDLIYGIPKKEQHGLFRNISSITAKIIFKHILHLKHARYISAFRAFRTKLRDSFAAFNNNHACLDVLLAWATTHIDYVKVKHNDRPIGKSNYNFRKLIYHALNIILGSSTFLLKLAIIFGLTASALGFILFLYVIIKFLTLGSVVQGFTFLATIVTIFAGVQLFTLGIIGEYLGRIYFKTMNKPIYAIRDMINIKEDSLS
jgi:undecaprenyl-phosphate 4-deoxy-4-formamido-L-arabinose transferase